VNLEYVDIDAGEGQLIVAFVSVDDGTAPDPIAVMSEIGRDAARRRAAGWQLASIGAWPARQTGTAGNVLFQSGGQFTTQLVVVVVNTRPT
jgi:hypothetical protein